LSADENFTCGRDWGEGRVDLRVKAAGRCLLAVSESAVKPVILNGAGWHGRSEGPL